MPEAIEPTPGKQREITFGDAGEEITAQETEVTDPPETETEETELTAEEQEAAAAAATEGKGKYRIGDQEFDTIEAAHAYATGQVQAETQNGAYRQIVEDALRAPAQQENVTLPPAAEALQINEEQLWANPKAFLENFAQQVQQKTAAEINQAAALKATGDQIWSEFTDRHPALADFRAETERYVEQNQVTVQKLIKAKGRAAGYDYIAMNLKQQFARYENALKPQKALPNGGTVTTPSQRGTSVTPPKPAKKPLSFAEQIKSIKKGKR